VCDVTKTCVRLRNSSLAHLWVFLSISHTHAHTRLTHPPTSTRAHTPSVTYLYLHTHTNTHTHTNSLSFKHTLPQICILSHTHCNARAHTPYHMHTHIHGHTLSSVLFYIKNPHQTLHTSNMKYGVATTSRLLKIIGLFCERVL